MRILTATRVALTTLLLATACGGEASECNDCALEPEVCANAEPVAVGWKFYDGPDSSELEGSCGGADAEKVFSFKAPASARYRVVVESRGTASVHVRTVCGRADSELLCERDNTRQSRLSAVGDFVV